MKLNIAYAVDENVTTLVSVSIASILSNNKSNDIEIIILNSRLPENCKKSIESLKKIKDFELRFVDVDKKEFENLCAKSWTITSFFRFKIASLCPDLDKIIYLDCDTMCRKDLKDFFNIDMKNKLVAARYEYDINERIKKIKPEIKSDWYFNSGVMVINLKRWREEKLEEKLFEQALNNPEQYDFIDQDILNIVIDDDKVRIDDNEVYLNVWWTQLKRPLVKRIHTLVHFIGPKPNNIECRNIYKDEWWKYAALVPECKKYTYIYKRQRIECFKEFFFNKMLFSNKVEYIVLGVKFSFKRKQVVNA